MDPGTALGITSLCVQVCQGLLTYYDGWKSYHTDISSTYERIADLSQTFVVLKASLEKPVTSSIGEGIIEGKARVESCINSCSEGLLRLQKKLLKLRTYNEPQGIRQKAWAEMQRTWWPLRTSTVAKLKEQVVELRENLSLALQTLQQITLDQGLHRTADMISEVLSLQQTTQDKLASILSVQESAKLKNLFDWLSPPDHEYDHRTARKAKAPGTGAWILESEKYKQWKSFINESSMLWLTGAAGCGKTILCSTVIEDLRTIPDTRLAFFYFSFSDFNKQSHARLLTSLIVQLFEQGQSKAAFDKLQQLYDAVHPHYPSTESLESVLEVCMEQPGRIIFALDAIDEIPENDRGDVRSSVLEWLVKTAQNSHQTRLFITSRKLADIEASVNSLLDKFCCILIDRSTADADIRTYVALELNKHPRLCKLNDAVKEKIREIFDQKAGGMFRWASCQLETLKKIKLMRPKIIEEVLNDLPTTLDATYERMLTNISDQRSEREEALKALRWLVFERRPLTVAELVEATLIDYMSEELVAVDARGPSDTLALLAGFIIVEDLSQDYWDELSDVTETDGDSIEAVWDFNNQTWSEPWDSDRGHENPRVRLAHFSIKEYLLSDRISRSMAHLFALRPEIDCPILAQSCIAYVLYYSRDSSKSKSSTDLESYPFLQYASKTWPILISKFGSAPPEHEARLLQSETSLQHWLLVHTPDVVQFRPFRNSVSGGDSLYYASTLGLKSLCQTLLEHDVDIDACHGPLGNVLKATALKGNKEMVKLLLANGADINARDCKREYFAYENPLQAAARTGNKAAVKLLLDNGADINAAAGSSGYPLQSALHFGHKETVKLLLESGADINSEVLHEALFRGEFDKVKLLLDYGADANAYHEERRETALEAAVRIGDRDIVTLLLDNGADVGNGPNIHALSSQFGTAILGADRSIAAKKEIRALLESYSSIRVTV